MKQVSKEMLIGDILRIDSGITPIFMESGMHCLGCPSSQMESLEDACIVHGINADEVISQVNSYLAAK